MKKTLVMLIAAVVALGLVTWLVTNKDVPPPPKSLKFSGYATAEQLDKERNRGLLDPIDDVAYPVDEIVVQRPGGETLRFVREGEGKALGWNMLEPIESPAVKFQVEKMVKVFKEDTLSVFSKQVKPEMLGLFDLEPDRRIGVTIKSAGSTWQGIDLWVGKVESGDASALEQPGAEAPKDTWVMVKGDDATVYRVASKDLREPFEAQLVDLRDKKLFSAKADDITWVSVTAPDGSKVVVEGDRAEFPPAGEGEEAKIETSWRIVEPSGFAADDGVKTLARNVANARAKEFVATDHADVAAGAAALAAGVWTITARTYQGDEMALTLAAGDDEAIWGQVVGKDELLRVEKFTGKNLRKTIADLRDKALFKVDEAALSKVQFAPEGAPPFTLDKRGEAWVFAATGATADLGSNPKTLVTAKATRYARADEVAAATMALANPEFTAGLGAGDQSWSIAFGAKIESDPDKGNRWAQVTADGVAGTPVLVQDYVAKRFRKAPADVRWKKLFAFAKDAVQRIELISPGGAAPTVLERPPGGDKLELADLPEGKSQKTTVASTVLNTLPNLAAKSFVTGEAAKDVGLTATTAWTARITTTDGATVTLLMEPAPEAGEPHAVADSGPLKGQIVTINTFQAKNLQKQAADFIE